MRPCVLFLLLAACICALLPTVAAATGRRQRHISYADDGSSDIMILSYRATKRHNIVFVNVDELASQQTVATVRCGADESTLTVAVRAQDKR